MGKSSTRLGSVAGQIQDYNCLTVGFDRYLLEFLELDASAFGQRVRDGKTATDLLGWSRTQRIETGGPMDEAGKTRFEQRLKDVAQKRDARQAKQQRVTAAMKTLRL